LVGVDFRDCRFSYLALFSHSVSLSIPAGSFLSWQSAR
jgi:hypothetical protein